MSKVNSELKSQRDLNKLIKSSTSLKNRIGNSSATHSVKYLTYFKLFCSNDISLSFCIDEKVSIISEDNNDLGYEMLFTSAGLPTYVDDIYEYRIALSKLAKRYMKKHMDKKIKVFVETYVMCYTNIEKAEIIESSMSVYEYMIESIIIPTKDYREPYTKAPFLYLIK